MTDLLDLSAAERAQFDPFDNLAPDFAIREVGGATVVRSGAAFTGIVPVWASLPPHRHRWPQLLFQAWGSWMRREAVPLPDGPAYGLIHSIWSGGYYHWLLESLPRLLVLEERCGREIVPLIPDYSGLRDVYRDSLAALGYAHAVPMPSGASARVSRLLVPQAPPLGHYDAPLMHRLRSRLVGATLPEGEGTPECMIYISRERARGRKVRNEADLRRMLEQRGFECVYLEEMDFAAQIRLFSRAKLVIGQHGAGLSNLLFMQPGTRLIEVHRKLIGRHRSEFGQVRRSYRYFPGYGKLAIMNGVHYRVHMSEPADAPRNLDTDDVLVDLDCLARQIDAAKPLSAP